MPALHAAGDETELARALRDLAPSFISFGISFFVIGRYWLAHHQFYSMLTAIDSRLVKINLVYLAFIAFLPFPTDLLGTYFDNAVSVATYAGAVAAVSGLEVVMFRHARQARLLRSAIPDDVYRWGVLVSLSPRRYRWPFTASASRWPSGFCSSRFSSWHRCANRRVPTSTSADVWLPRTPGIPLCTQRHPMNAKETTMVKDKLGDQLDRASGKAKQWAGRATGNAPLQRRGRFQSGLAKVRISARGMMRKLLATLRERSGR